MDANQERTQATISKTVRVYAAALDETHDDLAQVLGCSRSLVSQKLAGRYRWSLEDVTTLARHYGITVDSLIAGNAIRALGGSAGSAVAKASRNGHSKRRPQMLAG